MRTKRRQKESPAEHQRTDRQNSGICPFQCQRSEYRLGHAVKKLRQRNGKAYRCRIKACCVLNCRRDQPEIDPDTTVQCTDQAANKCNEYDTSCTVLLFLLNFRCRLLKGKSDVLTLGEYESGLGFLPLVTISIR